MKIDIKEVSNIISKYKGNKSALLAVLQDIQEKYNWLPPDTLKLVSEELCIPLINVYSVASFYHAFSLTPRGRHIITVCQGTACHVRGAPIILNHIRDRLSVEPGCTTKDEQFTLETVNCLGTCALAPIFVVDGNYYGQSTTRKVDAALAQYTKRKAVVRKLRRKTTKGSVKAVSRAKYKKRASKKLRKLYKKKKLVRRPKKKK